MRNRASDPGGEGNWSRRLLLRTLGGAGALGTALLPTGTLASAAHETDRCAVTIEFDRAQLARVRGVRAAAPLDLAVFYYDRDDAARKRAGIDPTTDADYGPLRVRYAPDPNETTVRIGGPNASIRRVVVRGPDCRSAATNPLESAAGENIPPAADFTWSPDRPTVGERVTFASTAIDLDGEVIHCGWDLDGDGTEAATGEAVVHAFDVAGDHDVTQRVVDDFDATDTMTKTVTVEADED